MKPLLAIFGARFRLLLQYRAAAWAGVVTQVFFGAVITAALSAFYAGAGDARQPLLLSQVVTYVWLGQAFFSLLPWRTDPEVREQVVSGGLAYELLRPVDLYALWFARALALKTAPVLLRALPLFVVAGLFLGLRRPASLEAALLWPLAVAGAVALSSAFMVLMNLSLLWSVSADGIHYLVPVLVMLLSGQLLPLPLFPEWFKPVLLVLPFRGLMDTPHRVWLGDLSGAAAAYALAHQWLWLVALIALGRHLLARGLRRVVIQGG
ncbi:MAG TPA: ABC-2 family transporter protein [Polyangia bacterium]|jgi:ABC-2 type transport system permease protein|nr:ABC-2 family transporter protein [Polyangia bacterium]